MQYTNAIDSSSEQAAHLSALGPLFLTSCVELAEVYGVSLLARPERAPPSAGDLAARVCFRGEEIWGDIGICLSAPFMDASLRSILDKPDESASERMLHDWAGELANQLVGRLKNKLRPFAVSFELSMPRVLSYSEAGRLKGELVTHFTSEVGTFSAYFTVRVAPGVVLRDQGTQSSLDEGDVLLF